MSTIRAFLRRHPVLAYYVLTFAISLGCTIPIWLGAGSIPPSKEEAEKLTAVFAIALVAGPVVAGPLMTGLVDGRAGFRDFLHRLLRWRVRPRWYAVALLTAPCVAIPLLFAMSLLSPEYLPVIVTTGDKASLIALGIGVGLGGGLCEEIGWTGFVIPRLRRRHGVLTTGLIMGLLWGLWHFPPFWETDTFSALFPVALLLGRLFSWLPPFRVIMVWLYDRTQSILLLTLMHASLIFTNIFVLAPSVTGPALLTWILVWAAALWIVVAVGAMVGRGETSRQSLRARPA